MISCRYDMQYAGLPNGKLTNPKVFWRKIAEIFKWFSFCLIYFYFPNFQNYFVKLMNSHYFLRFHVWAAAPME